MTLVIIHTYIHNLILLNEAVFSEIAHLAFKGGSFLQPAQTSVHLLTGPLPFLTCVYLSCILNLLLIKQMHLCQHFHNSLLREISQMSSFTMLRFEMHKLDYVGEKLNQKMCIDRASTANKLSVQCTGLALLQNNPSKTNTIWGWVLITSSFTAQICLHCIASPVLCPCQLPVEIRA